MWRVSTKEKFSLESVKMALPSIWKGGAGSQYLAMILLIEAWFWTEYDKIRLVNLYKKRDTVNFLNLSLDCSWGMYYLNILDSFLGPPITMRWVSAADFCTKNRRDAWYDLPPLYSWYRFKPLWNGYIF